MIVPVRLEPEALALAVKRTSPESVPAAPEVTVSQPIPETAVHAHPGVVRILKAPLARSTPTLVPLELREYVHAGAARTVNACVTVAAAP